MNTVEEVNSLKTDKLEGMEFCERYIRNLGKDLRTIFWLREDENGNHVFEVGYTTVVKATKDKK